MVHNYVCAEKNKVHYGYAQYAQGKGNLCFGAPWWTMVGYWIDSQQVMNLSQ